MTVVRCGPSSVFSCCCASQPGGPRADGGPFRRGTAGQLRDNSTAAPPWKRASCTRSSRALRSPALPASFPAAPLARARRRRVVASMISSCPFSPLALPPPAPTAPPARCHPPQQQDPTEADADRKLQSFKLDPSADVRTELMRYLEVSLCCCYLCSLRPPQRLAMSVVK